MESTTTSSKKLGEIEVILSADDKQPVLVTFTRADVRYEKAYYYDADWTPGQGADEWDSGENTESTEVVDRQLENLQIAADTANHPADARFEEINDDTNSTTAEYIILDERDEMAAMGLPTAFGDKRKHKNNRRTVRMGKDECAKFVMPSLKEYYGLQTLDSARPVFTRMGYFYETGVERMSQKPDDDETTVNNNESIQETTKIVQIHVAQPVDDVEEPTFIKPTVKDKDISKDPDTNYDENIDAEAEVQIEKAETVDESGSEYNSARSHLDDDAMDDDATNGQTKKKNKKKRNKQRADVPEEIRNDKNLFKYYYKRYTLFSLYDEGIKMDREAWFSATPECIAAHTAKRLRCDVIVDGFCGTGGNAIQFAMTCNKVIAIDIDPNKVEMAKHNANIYGVADRIEFIVGDYLQLAAHIKADVVFLSPPWGGPQYNCKTVYDLEADLLPVPASHLFATTARITKNIAMYLPKNSNTKQLIILAGAGNPVELEQNYLFSRVTAITAYYGDLIRQKE